jgi:hypothetical protein
LGEKSACTGTRVIVGNSVWFGYVRPWFRETDEAATYPEGCSQAMINRTIRLLCTLHCGATRTQLGQTTLTVLLKSFGAAIRPLGVLACLFNLAGPRWDRRPQKFLPL